MGSCIDHVLLPQVKIGPDVADGIQPATDQVIESVLRCRGVPEDKITILSGDSESTAGDFDLICRFLASRPRSSLAIVTSAFHTRRARWMIHRKLGGDMDRIVMVAAPNPDFYTDSWWETETGFRLITSEYAKLAGYWIMYGNGVFWIGCFVSIVLAIGLWRHWMARRTPPPTHEHA